MELNESASEFRDSNSKNFNYKGDIWTGEITAFDKLRNL